MMNVYQNEVISWIRSGQDYDDGLQLLMEISPKHHLLSQLRGGKNTMSGKLTYEICKAAGLANTLTWKKFVQDVKDAPVPTTSGLIVVSNPSVSTIKTSIGVAPDSGILPPLTEENKNKPKEFIPDSDADLKGEAMEENPLKDYPPIIRRIIHEYASMFQERSKLHTVMTEMDQSNAPPVMVKRAELFDLIKALSVRLEQFYTAKERFETDGTLPNESELFPVNEPQEEDFSKLNEEDLKKRKKLLQNGNSKDQSFLDYQSKEHGSTKNPMPAGPKRVKIEHRIKERSKLIEQIDTALLRYAIK